MQSHSPPIDAIPAPSTWSRPRAETSTRALPSKARRGLRVLVPHEVEVSHLTRYVAIAALAGACALLWAWSRIDLRKTAVALDLAERHYAAAQAEQARLNLELAALRDPARLERLGDTLVLDRTVNVVVVPPAATPATPKAPEVATR